jgi:galactose mutarotase-like enzyme
MSDAGALDFELEIAEGGTRALVAPNRGGMVTQFDVRSRPVLFLDRETFRDGAKNVRGGNPVLFPTPGKLAGDAWSQGGRSGKLGQHGFARNRRWAVVDRDARSCRLRLDADDATRADYPWDFRVDLTYAVSDGALAIAARVENRSPSPMPFGFGFHPYFAVKDKKTFALESGATRAFDNVTKREVPFDARSLEVGAAEIDLHLLDHGARVLTFALDDLRVSLDGAVARPHWVLWSLPGRDFVCVEPWTCPGNAMTTGERLLFVPPGEASELSFTYRVQPR